jgi:cAMP-specific phosphodiesterase
VAQLVNKLGPDGDVVLPFSPEDQLTFRTFAMFAGISLSNARLLEFVIKAGEEAMMLQGPINGEHGRHHTLRRRNTMTIDAIPSAQLKAVADAEVPNIGGDVMKRSFNLFAVRELDPTNASNFGAKVVADVFWNTGLPQKLGVDDFDVVVNFVCQCRRKYRQVPYHNFFHAVDAVQTVWTFLQEGDVAGMLTELDCYVLLVSALCHDLDHMGLNNNFHLKTDSPLGILSSASGNKSVLEVHHCNLAIEILQHGPAAMFAELDSTDSTAAYRMLIDNILATDMARHGELMSKFEEMCDEGYNRDDSGHRSLLCQMVLKAADISNVTKPFDVSRLWAIAVTEEFYQQGDKEKAKGVDVLPMFDRSLGTELAKGQIGFINFMARKYFTLLVSKLCTGMQWALDQLNSNCGTWESMLAPPPAEPTAAA